MVTLQSILDLINQISTGVDALIAKTNGALSQTDAQAIKDALTTLSTKLQ